MAPPEPIIPLPPPIGPPPPVGSEGGTAGDGRADTGGRRSLEPVRMKPAAVPAAPITNATAGAAILARLNISACHVHHGDGLRLDEPEGPKRRRNLWH